MYINIYICTHKYVYIYIYTFIHTDTHIYEQDVSALIKHISLLSVREPGDNESRAVSVHCRVDVLFNPVITQSGAGTLSLQ